MKLANLDQVEALDPVFGRMATEVGRHAWSLPALTTREQAFVFLAADLCTGIPLTRQLIAHGHEVIGLTRRPAGAQALSTQGAQP